MGLTMGMASGWCSPVLPYLQSPDSPIGGQPMTDESASWLGSLLCLSAFFATPIFSYLCNHYSRKITGYFVALPFVIGWIIILSTRTEIALLVARFIIGIGCGGSLIHGPLYVTEISEHSIRGSLGTILIFLFRGGVVVSYITGSYVSYTAFNCICLTVPVIYMLTFFWMPESPVYLMVQGREDEARKSLLWLRSTDGSNIDEELKILAEYIKGQVDGGTISDFFSNRGTIKAFLFSFILACNVEFTGEFVVITYTVSIFTDAGVNFSPYMSTILAGILLTAGVMAATVLIDRAGRKIIMLVSNLVIALCLGVIGWFFYYKSKCADLSSYGWVPVTSVCIYMVCFGIGVGTVPYVIIAETFPVKYKHLGSSFSIPAVWLIAFLCVLFFNDLVKTMGMHGTFWLFGGLCLLCEAIIHTTVPETKGKTLESILDEISGKKILKNGISDVSS